MLIVIKAKQKERKQMKKKNTKLTEKKDNVCMQIIRVNLKKKMRKDKRKKKKKDNENNIKKGWN